MRVVASPAGLIRGFLAPPHPRMIISKEVAASFLKR